MENNLSFAEYCKLLENIKKTEQGDDRIILTALISSVTKKEFQKTALDLMFLSPSSSFQLSKAEKSCLYDKISDFCNKKIPYQYLTGEMDFYGRNFFISEKVLIPRNDTEVLVEKTLSFVKKNMKILDLCCGSGCIGITIAAESGADVLLADFSSEAIKITEKNIKKFGLEKKCKTVLHDVKKDIFCEKFDIIVSNPPYIPSADIKTLSEYVKKEPLSALCGGSDGLDFYRIIAEKYSSCLNSGGYLLFECGIYQSKEVSHILELNGFINIGVFKDSGGVERIAWGCKK